jgi:hypothetical protein
MKPGRFSFDRPSDTACSRMNLRTVRPNAQTRGPRAGAGGETPFVYPLQNLSCQGEVMNECHTSFAWWFLWTKFPEFMSRPPKYWNQPIRILRDLLGFTNMYQLSEKTGINIETLHSACHRKGGNRNLSALTLIRIYLSTGYIWTGKDWEPWTGEDREIIEDIVRSSHF